MSEELNDNLMPEQNGSDGMENQTEDNPQNPEVQETVTSEIDQEYPVPDTEVEVSLTAENPVETEVLSGETIEANAPIEVTAQEAAVNAIADVNAEESEDVTLKGRHDIPMQDYDTLSWMLRK